MQGESNRRRANMSEPESERERRRNTLAQQIGRVKQALKLTPRFQEATEVEKQQLSEEVGTRRASEAYVYCKTCSYDWLLIAHLWSRMTKGRHPNQVDLSNDPSALRRQAIRETLDRLYGSTDPGRINDCVANWDEDEEEDKDKEGKAVDCCLVLPLRESSFFLLSPRLEQAIERSTCTPCSNQRPIVERANSSITCSL